MLTNYERLLQEADDENVYVDENYHFQSELGGLYIDGNIALSARLETSAERACLLAEELGHHFTSVGHIIDPSSVANRKQERQARMWGYDKLIGLSGLITAYEHGCRELYETAEFLNVTEEALQNCIDAYRARYGVFVKHQNYYVIFEPFLQILKDYN